MGEWCHGLMAGTACVVVPLATVLLCLLVVMSPRCAGEHGAAAAAVGGGSWSRAWGEVGAARPWSPSLRDCPVAVAGLWGA